MPKHQCPTTLPSAAQRATTWNAFRGGMKGQGCDAKTVGNMWKKRKREIEGGQAPQKRQKTTAGRKQTASVKETAAFGAACLMEDMDWNKCLVSPCYANRCLKQLEKKYPHMVGGNCPVCPIGQASAQLPKPVGPIPAPLTPSEVAALTEKAKKYAGVKGLITDETGNRVVGAVVGTEIKRISPPLPPPVVEAVPIILGDVSMKAALQKAIPVTPAKRKKIEDVSTATVAIAKATSVPPPPPLPKPTSKKAKTAAKKKAPAPKPQTGGRGELLQAIRGGAQLKKVQPITKKEKEAAEATGMAAILARAMKDRRSAISNTNSNGNGNGNGDDDDVDWE